MDRLPDMVDAVVLIMRRIDGLFATLEAQDVSGKAVATLGHTDDVMKTLRTHSIESTSRTLAAKRQPLSRPQRRRQ